MLTIRQIGQSVTLGTLDIEAFSAMHPEWGWRQLERAGARYALGEMLQQQDFTVAYDGQGKPFLPGSGLHISITHSHSKLAVLMNSREPVGIDIELVRDKVRDVRHKFLSESEQEACGDDVRKLIRYWAAKEALYKAVGKKGVRFRDHIQVMDDSGYVLQGRVNDGVKMRLFSLRCEDLGDYILVYTHHEIRATA